MFLQRCQGPGSRLSKALSVQKLLKSLVLCGISVILPGFTRLPPKAVPVSVVSDHLSRWRVCLGFISGPTKCPHRIPWCPRSPSLPLCPLAASLSWKGTCGEPCPGLVGALQESASLLKINWLWFIYPGKGAAGFPVLGPEAAAAVLLLNLLFQGPSCLLEGG